MESAVSSGSNLEIASEAVGHLQGFGHVQLAYLTAEFEPFSSAQRPDLLFTPLEGPNAGQMFVVELRMAMNPLRPVPSLAILREHRQFVADDTSENVSFALATDRAVEMASLAESAGDGIAVFDHVTSGLDLARRVLRWSQANSD